MSLSLVLTYAVVGVVCALALMVACTYDVRAEGQGQRHVPRHAR